MPAEPGADIGSVSSFLVWKTVCNKTFISSIKRINSGSRWPMVGRPSAESMRGLTSEGPGPISVLCGGLKLERVVFAVLVMLVMVDTLVGQMRIMNQPRIVDKRSLRVKQI